MFYTTWIQMQNELNWHPNWNEEIIFGAKRKQRRRRECNDSPLCVFIFGNGVLIYLRSKSHKKPIQCLIRYHFWVKCVRENCHVLLEAVTSERKANRQNVFMGNCCKIIFSVSEKVCIKKRTRSLALLPPLPLSLSHSPFLSISLSAMANSNRWS